MRRTQKIVHSHREAIYVFYWCNHDVREARACEMQNSWLRYSIIFTRRLRFCSSSIAVVGNFSRRFWIPRRIDIPCARGQKNAIKNGKECLTGRCNDAAKGRWNFSSSLLWIVRPLYHAPISLRCDAYVEPFTVPISCNPSNLRICSRHERFFHHKPHVIDRGWYILVVSIINVDAARWPTVDCIAKP